MDPRTKAEMLTMLLVLGILVVFATTVGLAVQQVLMDLFAGLR